MAWLPSVFPLGRHYSSQQHTCNKSQKGTRTNNLILAVSINTSNSRGGSVGENYKTSKPVGSVAVRISPYGTQYTLNVLYEKYFFDILEINVFDLMNRLSVIYDVRQ